MAIMWNSKNSMGEGLEKNKMLSFYWHYNLRRNSKHKQQKWSIKSINGSLNHHR